MKNFPLIKKVIISSLLIGSAINNHKDTLLFYQCMKPEYSNKYNYYITKCLITLGADINSHKFYSFNTEYTSIWHNIKCLFKIGDCYINTTPLTVAIHNDCGPNTVQLLLNNGACPNFVGNIDHVDKNFNINCPIPYIDKIIPLSIATSYDSPTYVNMLMAHGANPYQKFANRDSINCAIENCDIDMVKLLLKYPKSRDYNLNRPYILECFAIMEQREIGPKMQIAKLLVEENIIFDSTNSKIKMTLNLAIEQLIKYNMNENILELVMILLERGMAFDEVQFKNNVRSKAKLFMESNLAQVLKDKGYKL